MTGDNNDINPTISPTAKRVLDDFINKLATDEDIGVVATERVRHLIFGNKPPKADDFAAALFDRPEAESE